MLGATAAAVAATRYPPAGSRSFGPLRATLGTDTTKLESRVSVFAMIETAAALADVDEICAVSGLAGVYVGPADLAVSMGVDVTEATTDPAVREAMAAIHGAASGAGLVAAIHAGNSKAGHALAQLGFQMLTLDAESQALRRGAAASLREARGDR